MDLTKRTTQQRIIDTEAEFKEKYKCVKEQLRSDKRLDLSLLKKWKRARKNIEPIFIFGKNMSFIHVLYW